MADRLEHPSMQSLLQHLAYDNDLSSYNVVSYFAWNKLSQADKDECDRLANTLDDDQKATLACGDREDVDKMLADRPELNRLDEILNQIFEEG